MEGLRALARLSFRDNTCVGSTSDFDTISISVFPTQPATYRRERISDDKLRSFVAQSTPLSSEKGESANATLQLVRIPRLDNEDLCISPQTFHFVFECFRLDPSILYLVNNNSYGCHHFTAEAGDNGTTIHSVFIATVVYILTWSFDPHTQTTKAIIMTRAGNGLSSGHEAFRAFETILTLYQDYIRTPYLLAFVAVVQTVQFLDALVLAQLRLLRHAEAYTGHGAYAYAGPDVDRPELALEDISRLSTRVVGCLVGIANQQRHAEILDDIIALLDGPDSDTHDPRARNDNSLSTLQSALPVLRRQLKGTRAYNGYLQERARNQSSALSHLEALINNNLASSTQDLAAATQKDGEAMKTIAVMTMMFLPATFFAALFSVPSLHWGQRPVIQDGFGTYWAFTVPATALVFLVWFVVTNWEMVRNGVGRVWGGRWKWEKRKSGRRKRVGRGGRGGRDGQEERQRDGDGDQHEHEHEDGYGDGHDDDGIENGERVRMRMKMRMVDA